MMKRMQTPVRLLLLTTLLTCPAWGCRSPYYADRGAALGGVTGAITGGAIGKNSGNTAAGAVLGSAVGALTGAAIGDGIDQDMARSQAIVEQRMGRRMSGAVTVGDVMAMSDANLSDEVIISHIRAHGVAQPPHVQELIALRNRGVSDVVITTMQQAHPPQSVAPPPHYAPPVIIEEHYYGPRYHPYPRPYYRPPPRHRRPSGMSWWFSL